MCWVCLTTTPKPVRGCLAIWEDITWWLLCLSTSTRLRLGLPAALSTSQSSLTTDMVGNTSGYHPSMLKITHWINQRLSSPAETFCQRGRLPQNRGSVIRADSEKNKTHSYSSCTLTMAFLLKHVTPLKLWVVGIVYLALSSTSSLSTSSSLHHLFLFASPPLLPLSTSCCASCIVWILARPISDPYFSTESYYGLLPVLLHSQTRQLLSAKYVLYQLENASNKNSHGWEWLFRTADVIDNSRQKGYKGGTMNKFRFRIAVKCPDSEHKLAHKTALH